MLVDKLSGQISDKFEDMKKRRGEYDQNIKNKFFLESFVISNQLTIF